MRFIKFTYVKESLQISHNLMYVDFGNAARIQPFFLLPVTGRVVNLFSYCGTSSQNSVAISGISEHSGGGSVTNSINALTSLDRRTVGPWIESSHQLTTNPLTGSVDEVCASIA